MTEYKVVETSVVTDEELTRILNDTTREGWRFEGIQFAMREASKRPAMAFVLFCRSEREQSESPITQSESPITQSQSPITSDASKSDRPQSEEETE